MHERIGNENIEANEISTMMMRKYIALVYMTGRKEQKSSNASYSQFSHGVNIQI